MSQSVKQCCGGWLILCGAFFAGASAGSIGYDLGRGACVSHTIEGLLGLVSALQSSRPHALSDQRTGKQIIRRGLSLLNLDWAGWMVDDPGVKTNPNGRIAYGHLRADHGECRGFHLEQIAYPDFDFSLLVAQRHPLSMGLIGADAIHFTSLSCPRPLVLASRITGSAPADLLLAGWRDRPHVPLRHPSDPSWYSQENVKQLLDDKPQAVNKLLTWIFKPNQLTRHEREGIAMDLELIPTVPAHLELVQRSAKQRRQSRKEAAA